MRSALPSLGRRSALALARRTMATKPSVKPALPNFSSGPCAKRPGYDLQNLAGAPLGRSHRAKVGKSKLAGAIDQTRELLAAVGLPDDYHIGIVPASDTGAVEMSMWSLLGARPVTCVHFENFGGDWYKDLTTQLKLPNVTELTADYGKLPDLDAIDWKTDVVFTYNGTTAGARIPESWAPPADREGLAICDATSAVFAMDMPWANLDVVTFSWQKCLGGEGAHGMLILSPRAVERLESYTPPWPLPKIFRMTKNGKLDKGIFEGSTINTPSMLANEDYLDALAWSKSIGGYRGLVNKSKANLAVVEKFVAENEWMEFLTGDDESIRSCTSVCLKINDLDAAQVKKMAALLEVENVALDIGAYRSAPAGFRIWCGPTVEVSDLEAAMPWFTWAHAEVKGA
jgi:phosphoserine aminotransferase